ncbi:MAG: hypothetical protein ACR2JW_07910, partial [Thermomicrobiales bacterium]
MIENDRASAITRRLFVQRAAILLGTLVTAACGANQPTPVPATVRTPPTPIIKPTPVAQPTAPTPTPTFDQTLVVDLAHPNANDANPGTDDRPLKTIAKAADLAMQNNLRKVSTRVIIAPGAYRESPSIQAKTNLTDTPMQFEARQHGTVMIAGSDVWAGWKKQGATNTYTHAWPYKWGLTSYPKGWEGNVVLQPIVRRREMIFINGQSLTQVLSTQELKAGAFFVSEQASTVSIVPPAGVAVENATVEVAVRPGLFFVEGAQNLTIQGLTFMHGNSPVGETAVIFNNCSNVLVEDCGFFWNNWSGMTFQSGGSA